MGVLICLAVLVIVCPGCYEPTLTDCQVSCAADDACAGDQVCDHGWCVDPSARDTCDEPVSADARPPEDGPPEVTTPDAAVPDAALDVALRVVIEGRGRVAIGPIGEVCESLEQTGADCTYQVPAATSIELLAVSVHHNWQFESWTTGACTDQGAQCSFQIDRQTLIGARFRAE